ncbi:MAG: ATP-grasp domain-containing protein [Dethiosulfatibacter sp.]|nr:ATP-grasp domain-containing protein [Dethiosulfatibacter sp.]
MKHSHHHIYKLIVLGGGNCQVALLKYLHAQGHHIILLDYLMEPPGKKYAHIHKMISTFDISGIVDAARQLQADAIITAGTDQPVYAGACASETLNLPFYISSELAYALTHKKKMKSIFVQHDIPTVKFGYLTKDLVEGDMGHLAVPIVVKPYDSQGQRGVLKVNHLAHLTEAVKESFSFTHESEILWESYYPNDEITVSGWVVEGTTHILSVADRVTYDTEPHIGICTAHHYPSKYYNLHKETIIKLTEDLVQAFGIIKGPIYFQMLVGNKGILVNETAARIGGAFEDVYIKSLYGLDLNGLLLNDVLGIPNRLSSLNYMDTTRDVVNVILFFAYPGTIAFLSDMNELLEEGLIIDGAFNFKEGDEISPIRNATGRAGHLVIIAQNINELNKKTEAVLDCVVIKDQKGHNLLIRDAQAHYRGNWNNEVNND